MLWRREGVPITSHTAPGVVLRSQRQILEIPRVRLMDAGFYQCGASNKAGRTERDFVIKVLSMQTISHEKTNEYLTKINILISNYSSTYDRRR